ncbi:MAG TPA: pentapeptide repeat-containing protein, partial [Streptosporangiaceae bacterium]|nr:pentapeptide repeat-containing protein [Streptosporangiaceae bacterium]
KGNGRQESEQREEQRAEPQPEFTVRSHGRESTLIGAKDTATQPTRLPSMDWQDLADVPFAAALSPHAGGLAPGTEYDGLHFDQLSLDEPRAASSRFIECAFTKVSFQGGWLQRARFADVLLRDVRLIATGLAETQWADVALAGCMAAGVEAFGAKLRRVTLRGCKLDSVNFRGAELTEVTFDHCDLRDVDFAGATLARTAFPNSRLARTDFTRVTMDATDLRGAELGIIVDATSLRGAIISTAQLVHLAPVLAETLGITVTDA